MQIFKLLLLNDYFRIFSSVYVNVQQLVQYQKQELCVEHHKCAYHNQVPGVKYTESYNTRIKLKLTIKFNTRCT